MRKLIIGICICIGLQTQIMGLASIAQMYQLLKDTAVEIAHLARISQLLDKLNVLSEKDNKNLQEINSEIQKAGDGNPFNDTINKAIDYETRELLYNSAELSSELERYTGTDYYESIESPTQKFYEDALAYLNETEKKKDAFSSLSLDARQAMMASNSTISLEQQTKQTLLQKQNNDNLQEIKNDINYQTKLLKEELYIQRQFFPEQYKSSRLFGVEVLR